MALSYEDYLLGLAFEIEAEDPELAATYRDQSAHESLCPVCGYKRASFTIQDVREVDDLPHDWVCSACLVDRDREMQSAIEEDAKVNDLARAKGCALDRLRDLREDAIQNRFVFGEGRIALNDQTQGRVGDAVQGMKLVMDMGLDAEPSVQWQVSAGNFVTMNYAMLQAFGAQAFLHVQACFARARELSAEIEAALTANAVRAIDLTEEWPGAGLSDSAPEGDEP